MSQLSTKKKEFLNKTKLEFYKEIKKYQKELKPTKEIEGFPCSAIVGEKNYPNLATHNISNENQKSSYQNTSEIVKKNYNDIIKLKAKNILGTTNQIYIKKTNEKINEEIQNIYKSKKSIEFASNFEKELSFKKILINKVSGIIGSKNPLISLKATQNTTTSKQIEKYSKNDIKAKEAIISLYERGINEHQIINLLALGSFGIQINKKLVPTKWAISAYDQTLEKHLHKKIIYYKPIEDFEIYEHKDKGNHFVIILIPDTFQAEIIESFPGAIEKDYVNFDNKLHKESPETSGGYYATKFPIFEQLIERKKQAAFISLRIISNYDIPLGVVFVRESVRAALKNKIFKTSNEKELENFLHIKFPNHSRLYQTSNVLVEKKKQKKLNAFF
ncbi:MAG: hypothetical protein KC589_00415 [Nanoarchaeota archaeon]|nr:hypothetical protein [Nanoarchaeota archaeon]